MAGVRTISLRVTGRVQGVWFRASAKQVADSLGITGHVRNANDGSVAIHATGTEQALEEFIAWCRKGPQLARVDQLDMQSVDPVEVYDGFRILRD